MTRVALMASGSGTNALNLLERAGDYPNVRIDTVIVDTMSSPLPEILGEKFPEVEVKRILPMGGLRGEDRRREHETRILEVLRARGTQYILLAGYMRIIGGTLLGAFVNRIVNIHPSLLPLYPGVDSYRRAFEDGVTESGVTLHLVDEGVDTGPVLFQESFPRYSTDTLQGFIQRGKELEWKLYPKILEALNSGSLR